MSEAIKPTFPISLDTQTAYQTYQAASSDIAQVYSRFLNNQTTALQNPTQAYNVDNLTVNPDSIQGSPNPLNDYDSYTYHIRFSLVEANSAYQVTPDNMRKVRKIVIAESGVTAGFNISKFTLSNTVSPGYKHQNMNVMEWKMTITEPFGLNFPDYILAAGKNLGIENTNRFPYFIEIWFDGYDESGKLQPEIGGLYKAWRVLILNVGLVTNQTGTVYELTGIADNDLVNSNQMALTKSTLKLDQVQTLQDVTDQLSKTLTDDAKKAENTTNSTQYKINLPTFMRQWRIDPADSSKNDARNRSIIGTSIPINRGQDIGAFILTAMGKCGNEADNFFYGTTGTSNESFVETHGLARWVQIVPTMTLGNYIPALNDYQKTITYNIQPYFTPRCVKDPEGAEKQRRLSNQKRKFSFLKSQNMIAKKYEYFYTGKNTEVIKFDIQIENFWQITLPSYWGGRTYGNYTQGALVDPDSQGFRENRRYSGVYQLPAEIAARTAQAIDLINNISSGNFGALGQYSSVFGGLGGSINQFTSTIGGLTSGIGQLTNMAATLQNLSAGNIGSLVSQARTSINTFGNLATINATPISPFETGTASTLQSITSNTNRLVNTASTLVPSVVGGSQQVLSSSQQNNLDSYLEAYTTQGDDALADDPLKVAFFVDQSPTIQQASFNGSEQKNTPSAATKTGTYPTSQGMFSQTIGNMYDKTYMLNISITIRGDPWWIGMTNLDMNEYLKSGGATIPSNAAPFFKGENMFFLTFKTASNYDEQTGIMNPSRNSQTFNGLYCVQMVENIFENGSFTQKIEAYKETWSQSVNKLLTGNTDQPTQNQM